jgi:hypothetical protein
MEAFKETYFFENGDLSDMLNSLNTFGRLDNTHEFAFNICNVCEGPAFGHKSSQADCKRGKMSVDDRQLLERYYRMSPGFEFYKDFMDTKEVRPVCGELVEHPDGTRTICGVRNANRSDLKTHVRWMHGKSLGFDKPEVQPSQDGMADVLYAMQQQMNAILKLVDNRENKDTVQITRSKPVPVWAGGDFDLWKSEVVGWAEKNTDDEYHKCQDLIESLKKNETVKKYVVDVILEGTVLVVDKTVKKVLDIMSDRFEKTKAEKLKDVFKNMIGMEQRDDEDFESYLDRFTANMVEIDKMAYVHHVKYLMGRFFVDRAHDVTPEEILRMKDAMEDTTGDERKPKNDDVVSTLKKQVIALKIENNRTSMKTKREDTVDARYTDNRSRHFA